MADERLRELERARNESPAAEARWLAAALRAGRIPVERLELAAFLGDEPALAALDGWGPIPPDDLIESLAGLPRNASGRMLVAATIAFAEAQPHDLVFEARRGFVAALVAWSRSRYDQRGTLLESLAAFERANGMREEQFDFQPRYQEALFLTHATTLALAAGRTLRAWWTRPVPEPDPEHAWMVETALQAAEELLALRNQPETQGARPTDVGLARLLLEGTREWILEGYVAYVKGPGLAWIHQQPYERGRTYEPGQRIVHPTHGLGRVKEAGARTIVVRFADGRERSLVHGPGSRS